MRLILLFALLLHPSLVACTSAQRGDLDRARDLWERQSAANYSIEVMRVNPMRVLPRVRIVVVDGLARDVDVVPFEEPFPPGIGKQPVLSPDDSARAGRYTVDSLFSLVESSIADGSLKDVDYDPEYGYPTRLFIDPIPDAIDDEWVITTRRLIINTGRDD